MAEAIDKTISADAVFMKIPDLNQKLTSVTVFNRLHDKLGCVNPPQFSNKPLWKSGIALGRKLVHALRIRINNSTTTLPRYKSGSIDKRLLAQAGIGIDTVFNRYINAPHRPVLINYTIDASSSMAGDKFENALRIAIALVYVSKNLKNIHFVASMRYGQGAAVHVYKLFDSNIDNIAYAKKFMPRLKTHGGTPEGMGIYPLLPDMKRSNCDRKILINISDGMPSDGLTYTALVIREFRNSGIDIISYYVDSFSKNRNDEISEKIMKDFKFMYGKDSEYIDVKDFQQISKTINSRLLEK